MVQKFKIEQGRLVEVFENGSVISIYINPSDLEKKALIEEFKIDEYDINSALDPNEPARVEFEDTYTTLILNAPKRYSVNDNFLFKISSFGIFIQGGRLIILLSDDMINFQGRVFSKINSNQHLILKVIYRNIMHFEEHLQAIQKISEDLERQINWSMENKHLINMFNLEKSLVYYLKALASNTRIIEKMRVNAAKLGFSESDLDFLEDVVIENSQCVEQANIFSQVSSNLMDAWASIINNNLSIFIKKLTLATLCVMLPTLVFSAFSMNVRYPFEHDTVRSFWAISILAFSSSAAVFFLWRWKKW